MIKLIFIFIIAAFLFFIVIFPDILLSKSINKVSSKRNNKVVEELKGKIVELTVEVNELKERVYLLEKTNEIVDTIKKKKMFLIKQKKRFQINF